MKTGVWEIVASVMWRALQLVPICALESVLRGCRFDSVAALALADESCPLLFCEGVWLLLAWVALLGRLSPAVVD